MLRYQRGRSQLNLYGTGSSTADNRMPNPRPAETCNIPNGNCKHSCNNFRMANRRKFIIDTDAGVDDAQAIMMALSAPDVDVTGITTVSGNTDAVQVGRNVLRVLQASNRLDIPVYVGCSEPLLGDTKPRSEYHGSDGFGDAPDSSAPDDSHLQSEHGVQALLRLSKEHAGEVTLVCIGPLTNVAMAIRMDPQFGKRVKHCYIMGGNYKGKGNMTTSAEFNFYCDPEAAYVVLNQLGCSITLVPWEVCDENYLSWTWYEQLKKASSPKAQLVVNIEGNILENFYKPLLVAGVIHGYVMADQFAMAAALEMSTVKTGAVVYATVEMNSCSTKGQTVVDWNNLLKKSPNVTIVTEFHLDSVKNMVLRSVTDA